MSDYEAIKSAAYRKLDSIMPSVFAGPEQLRKAIAELPNLRKWAKALPDRDTRKAYLYWLGYHERRLPEKLQEEINYRRSKELESAVPTPPTLR